LRELGGVISAVYGLLFLNLLRTLRAGESAYTAFVEMMRTPPILYVNLVLFALLVWHAVTWFMLIGKAQPIQFTERPLPWKAVFGLWPSTPAASVTFAAHWPEPLVRLFFFALIGGSLFHGTHRLKFMLVDAGLRGPGIQAALDVILNAIAIVGTLGALYYAVR